MKNAYAILVSFALVVATSAPASAFDVLKPVKKVGFYAYKTALLPVYLFGGAATGSVAGGFLWYHVGGYENEVGKLFAGVPVSKSKK